VYEPDYVLNAGKNAYVRAANDSRRTTLELPLPVGIAFWAGTWRRRNGHQSRRAMRRHQASLALPPSDGITQEGLMRPGIRTFVVIAISLLGGAPGRTQPASFRLVEASVDDIQAA